MSLIPAKDYYGKDESITSVRYTLLCGDESMLIACATDTMAEEEEADPGGATGSQASKVGSRLTQVCQRCHGRECAKAKA
jgi:hypothetical protein